MHLNLRRAATAVAALTLPTLVLLAPAASAHGGHHGGTGVVASGLNNPRHLSFSPGGDLYVAEAGTGGAGPCMDGPEGRVCFGLTGSVTKVHNGRQSRVLTGLPSLGSEGTGNQAIGPADIQVTGSKRFALSMGLGAPPAVRAMLPAAGQKLDTLQVGKLGRGMVTLSDLGAYETAANPDGGELDSNPVGITPWKGGWLVADAGANAVNVVRPWGRTTTLATFPDTMVTAPWGAQVEMQAVPTSVVVGPDGAVYVSQLTGFPFPVGGATIWRIGRHSSTPTVYASGLTNVTDLAFRGNQLYAVQIATTGLLTEGLPMGSLVKVNRGSTSPKVVAGNLPAPYGLAIRSGKAYVTTCSVCAGGGSVMSFRL